MKKKLVGEAFNLSIFTRKNVFYPPPPSKLRQLKLQPYNKKEILFELRNIENFTVVHFYASDINECTNNPCKNSASCVNLAGSYRCDCKSGYTGNNCETGKNVAQFFRTIFMPLQAFLASISQSSHGSYLMKKSRF